MCLGLTDMDVQLEDSRTRLEEALRAKQRLEVDAVQTGARLKQKELQFQQLTLQRDVSCSMALLLLSL